MHLLCHYPIYFNMLCYLLIAIFGEGACRQTSQYCVSPDAPGYVSTALNNSLYEGRWKGRGDLKSKKGN